MSDKNEFIVHEDEDEDDNDVNDGFRNNDTESIGRGGAFVDFYGVHSSSSSSQISNKKNRIRSSDKKVKIPMHRLNETEDKIALLGSDDGMEYEENGEVPSHPSSELSHYSGKKKLSVVEVGLLNSSYLGLNMMLLLLMVEVVPAQINAIVGNAYKGIVLGITVALGAVVTFILGPMVGMKSDRLVSKYGRRQPIICISTVVFCVSCMFLVSVSPPINVKRTNFSTNQSNPNGDCHSPVNLTLRRCEQAFNKKAISFSSPNVTAIYLTNRIYVYTPIYLLVISSYISIITPYNALIADKSRHDQRGLCSGAMGGMTLLGNIFGACLGLLISPLGAFGTVVIGLTILVLCVITTVYSVTDVPINTLADAKEADLTCQQMMARFYLPLKDHNFRWLFVTRFLMQQALTSIIGFLEYYVHDMIPLPPCWSIYRAVSFLLMPMLLIATISSVINGIISDKTGQRKVILIITSVVMASVSVVMSIIYGPNAYYITVALAVIFGIALGGYQAVDFALLMDILPDEKEQSLTIAVWHQAMVLPQALAVPMAGIIVHIFERVNCTVGLGYKILMIVIAVYYLLGGLLINKIRIQKKRDVQID